MATAVPPQMLHESVAAWREHEGYEGAGRGAVEWNQPGGIYSTSKKRKGDNEIFLMWRGQD